jgi:hypothetical protein
MLPLLSSGSVKALLPHRTEIIEDGLSVSGSVRIPDF